MSNSGFLLFSLRMSGHPGIHYLLGLQGYLCNVAARHLPTPLLPSPQVNQKLLNLLLFEIMMTEEEYF